jgi:hypothetical protein
MYPVGAWRAVKPKVRRGEILRNLGLSMLVTPIGMFPIGVLAAFREPGLVVEDWDFFVPFFLVPMAAGAGLWVYSKRLAAKPRPVEKPE